MSYQLHQGDCLETLRGMADNSVDSIVTDPPYGLSFMGKKWDYDVPKVEVWEECLRVLKPGGHLLAFAGTRTQHRMAVRIEDAGFEIRDMIAWVYGSGFPKSLDVSKAIDKAAGAEREVIGPGTRHNSKRCAVMHSDTERLAGGVPDITAPATEAARQWQGWGTALKPALETVTYASKPYTEEQERGIIKSNLFRLEARLWLLSFASAAEKSSTSSQSEFGAAFDIAQWTAEELTSTRAALCAQMDTSRFELAANTSLNIVSSWRRILAESWNDGSTFTTETKSSTTTDLKTLRFSLSQITPASIIKACSLTGGFNANASIAESHFNASLLLLQSIHTLSVTERAISQAQRERQGAGVTPSLDPCIMARKPLGSTVAECVLAHGTGALNIDGCRVVTGAEDAKAMERANTPGSGRMNIDRRAREDGNFSPLCGIGAMDTSKGRWPANLIHDGSPEVLAGFPEAPTGAIKPYAQAHDPNATPTSFLRGMKPGHVLNTHHDASTGSAARFFYCAKASKRDRDEGLEGFEEKGGAAYSNGNGFSSKEVERGRAPRDTAHRNIHPTVKPTDLMAYLCRLVTPPGGVVLDPFMGSGSTGKAAMREGFRFVGCELSSEYLDIARARIAHELARVTAANAPPAPAPQFDLFAS